MQETIEVKLYFDGGKLILAAVGGAVDALREPVELTIYPKPGRNVARETTTTWTRPSATN